MFWVKLPAHFINACMVCCLWIYHRLIQLVPADTILKPFPDFKKKITSNCVFFFIYLDFFNLVLNTIATLLDGQEGK